MAFKLNIGDDKGKAWKLEYEGEFFIGKKIGDKFNGKEVANDLDGYELEITGTSNKSGFPGARDIDSPNLVRRLLTKGFGMKKAKQNGLRRKKTLRGGIISEDIVQINMKVVKEGKKKLAGIFPDQNKPKEESAQQTKEESKNEEKAKEEKKPAEKAEAKEETKKSDNKEEGSEEKKNKTNIT